MMEVSFRLIHAIRNLISLHWSPDKAQVILEPSLVKSFRNAPTDKALEVPICVKDSFKCDNGSVANLLAEKQENEAHFNKRLSDILLLPLSIYP
ncbi:hypothetical protein FRC00_010348, partial [Tulasnella sp. 408]